MLGEMWPGSDARRNEDRRDVTTTMCSAAAPDVAFPAERLAGARVFGIMKKYRRGGGKHKKGRGHRGICS